ncbi:hypothetical protein BHE74_00040543 [Ensete ventricosum]|nr:hypothetical protein BHE74_00040543 [Ensete ventricosum]
MQPRKPSPPSSLLPLLPTACRHCQLLVIAATLFLPPLPATALITLSALLPADPALSFLLRPALPSRPFIIFILQPPSPTSCCCHPAKLQQPSYHRLCRRYNPRNHTTSFVVVPALKPQHPHPTQQQKPGSNLSSS